MGFPDQQISWSVPLISLQAKPNFLLTMQAGFPRIFLFFFYFHVFSNLKKANFPPNQIFPGRPLARSWPIFPYGSISCIWEQGKKRKDNIPYSLLPMCELFMKPFLKLTSLMDYYSATGLKSLVHSCGRQKYCKREFEVIQYYNINIWLHLRVVWKILSGKYRAGNKRPSGQHIGNIFKKKKEKTPHTEFEPRAT